jgi:hypothetical protein
MARSGKQNSEKYEGFHEKTLSPAQIRQYTWWAIRESGLGGH